MRARYTCPPNPAGTGWAGLAWPASVHGLLTVRIGREPGRHKSTTQFGLAAQSQEEVGAGSIVIVISEAFVAILDPHPELSWPCLGLDLRIVVQSVPLVPSRLVGLGRSLIQAAAAADTACAA